MAQIRVGDVGTEFVLTVQDDGAVVNLGTATSLSIVFGKPDGTQVTKTASLVSDGTDGKMVYVIQAGDLDQPGDWRFQALVVFPAGTWRSDIQTFRVYENL